MKFRYVPLLFASVLAGGVLAGCADTNNNGVGDTPSAQKANEIGAAAGQKAHDAAADAAHKTGAAANAAGEAVDTAATTGKIKAKLMADPNVGAAGIDVDTSNDVVTLTGVVATAAAKKRAEEIVKGHEGVKSVVNNLTVQGH